MPYRNPAAPSSALMLAMFLLFVLMGAPAWARYAGEGLRLSYESYPELAAAVRQRLDSQAAPAPALGALARELTAGRPDRQARALALADWVRSHIRLVGARVRFDGAAPREAAAVLAQRSGNVEEIVVLLRALLAESGIDSTAALLRRGDGDGLPEAAMPAAFDHMLVYLPGLGLYLDPSADTIAPGYLPPPLLGKPVLLASGGFAMTPMTQPQGVSTKATVDIGRDGKGLVSLDRTYTGALAEPFRKAVRDAPPALREQIVRRMLPGLSPQGRDTLAPRTMDVGAGAFRMSLSGVGAQVLALPRARAMATIHPYLGTVADAVANMAWDSAGGRMVACPAVDASDETRYQLPKQVKILALPAPVSVTRGGVFYRADYERQGNAVLVKRRLTFRNGRPSCTPAEVRAMRPALERVAHDLRSRVTIAMR
jgi:transglutaminase-like putative cysteine protease